MVQNHRSLTQRAFRPRWTDVEEARRSGGFPQRCIDSVGAELRFRAVIGQHHVLSCTPGRLLGGVLGSVCLRRERASESAGGLVKVQLLTEEVWGRVLTSSPGGADDGGLGVH